jgi:aspartyl/asparaginyl-tRNA synthetase
MQLYCIQLNLAQLEMDMFRLSQHVEDEFQAFLELLCASAIVLKSQMPKENIEISNILVKEEKIELLSKVKEEIIELRNKGKEETKKLQSKRKHSVVDCKRRDTRAMQDKKSPR